MEKPNVRFHDGQILSEEPLNKAMEAVDYAVEQAQKVPEAVNAASSAAGSASQAASSAAAIEAALEAIKGSGDIPAATVAKVSEHEAEISSINARLNAEPIEFRDYLLTNQSGNWTSNTDGYGCYIVPVKEGDKVVVEQNTEKTYFARLSSYNDISYVSQYGREEASAIGQRTITATAGVVGIYIMANKYDNNAYYISKLLVNGVQINPFKTDSFKTLTTKVEGKEPRYVNEIPIEHTNKYATNTSTNVLIVAGPVENSFCRKYKVLGVKQVSVTTTQVSSVYNVTAIFEDENSNVLKKVFGSLNEVSIDVPIGAVNMYVNGLSTEDVYCGGILSLKVSQLEEKDKFSELSNKINGKRIVCFGDSITWYDGNAYTNGKEQGTIAKGYESYLREYGAVVTNKGYSGAYLEYIFDNMIVGTDMTAYDYVTITSGANDSRYQIPKGEIMPVGSNFDTKTFIGALQKSIEYVINNNPEIKVLLMTPIQGWIYAPDGYAVPKSSDGIVEEKYADAIKEVGAFYGIAVCDWYHNSGINLLTRSLYINDPEPNPSLGEYNPNKLYSVHPSTKGYKRMAEVLLPIINSI